MSPKEKREEKKEGEGVREEGDRKGVEGEIGMANGRGRGSTGISSQRKDATGPTLYLATEGGILMFLGIHHCITSKYSGSSEISKRQYFNSLQLGKKVLET